MRVGTKSILFGVHNIFIHPYYTYKAWRQLYGTPRDYRLIVAFIVHDWGYWGKPNMDGEEGERHPEFGASVMRRLFGQEWGDFTLCHSRHHAKAIGREFSQLCVADKLASAIYPRWLFVGLGRLSGEIAEYRNPKSGREPDVWIESIKSVKDDYEWFDALRAFLIDWANQHRDAGTGLPQAIR